MAKSLLGALALAASLPAACGFRNTSPYFLYSTADLNLPASDADVAPANAVVDRITAALRGCPTKTYFVVQQQGVSSVDFSDTSRSAPRLADHLTRRSDYIKSTLTVPEVIEDASAASALVAHLQSVCGAQVLAQGKPAPINDHQQRLVHVSFASPPADRHLRSAQLGQWDWELQQLVSQYADFEDFTVVYTSTPQTQYQAEHPPYEMENPLDDAVQMELKRDLSAHKRADSNDPGLFERYQYFTPGLFMAFAAAVPLFLIVLVGIKALLSLEVSYFAFSKEMGPAAQRKQ